MYSQSRGVQPSPPKHCVDIPGCLNYTAHKTIDLPEKFQGYISEHDFQCYMSMLGCVIYLPKNYKLMCSNRPILEGSSKRLALADVFASRTDRDEYRMTLLEYVLHAPELLFERSVGYSCVHLKDGRVSKIRGDRTKP